MNTEAKIRAVWCLNLFKVCEASRNDLLFRWVKIKIALECVGLVVLISSSRGEPDGSRSNRNSEDYRYGK